MKERALKKLPAPKTKSARLQASDRLLEFLDGL
jgi:hypothetical protein